MWLAKKHCVVGNANSPALSRPTVVVQFLSHVWFFMTPWIVACLASPLHYLTEIAQTHTHWVGDAIQPSHPLSSPSPPAPNPSQHRIGVSALVSVLPMNNQDWSPLGWTGWISLQSKGLSRVLHHSSKASILQRSAFFTVQLSHPYMTTGKTIALTRWPLLAT